jgi:hypothetical protein
MSEKSHVTLEQKACVVCCQAYDTGALLTDTRLEHVPGHWGERQLRKTFDHKTVTGWGLCPTCDKIVKDGYVALIEVKNSAHHNTEMKPNEADRTGRVVYLRRRAWSEILTVPCPPEDHPFCFISAGIVEMFEKMQRNISEH